MPIGVALMTPAVMEPLPFSESVPPSRITAPPIPSARPRRRSGGTFFGDIKIRHRQLWDQPDAFNPDRFLPENAGSRERYSYLPFSIGPRVCAGAAFGFTEAILCIATLAQRARLVLAPGAVVEPVCRLTLRPSDDALPMLLTHRTPQTAGAVAGSTSASDVAANPVS